MAGTAVVSFLVGVAVVDRPADPQLRLPASYRLADLIDSQQRATERLRSDAGVLREQVEMERRRVGQFDAAEPERQQVLERAAGVAGLAPVDGPGLVVTLSDSTRRKPPAGATVNDLVIHSQDVQAVVNGLWRAGAKAISINEQRLVATSAVLCVGNTLLLNGTVHSPPYVVAAVDADLETFEADALVRRLRSAATTYRLVFTVERVHELEVPGYRGSTTFSYARPVEPAALP